MKYEKICKTLDDTKELAENFAKLITNGCFISLYGEIGAGKIIRIIFRISKIKIAHISVMVIHRRISKSSFAKE